MSSAQASFSGTIDARQFSRVQSALLPVWSRWYVFAPTCLLAFLALGIGWGEAFANPVRAIPDLVWGLGVFVACLLLTWYGRRRAWQNYVRLHGSISGQVSQQGIEWKTEASNTVLPWEKLLGFRMSSDLVLVFYAPRCAFFLPRSFFASTQEWTALQEVLTRHTKAL
ncbi:YcxB family protein [Paucibacter sp. XJ19-41]|uniref:YcxB family protein n=1 Tax=Paucibacter sp. XJ19-41 TaxID=2927824 RepID=UPI00234BD5F3|nr:YcxB family protein [Paucibacter sp. XJ19-41]MDC6169708.1 YcxB family protein [Paucibacter sp. XJ19-41]